MFECKKIIIIGCSGAGKSRFAGKLVEVLHLPLYHLDMLNWLPNKTHIDRTDLIKKLEEIISNNQWIIDGNYLSTLELRMKACDLIYFFDMPVDVCLNGIMNRDAIRPDMPCILDVDDEFIEYVRNFNRDCRPKIIELFNKYPDKKVITFHSHNEVDKYIKNLPGELEYWDIYDMNRNKIGGRKAIRGVDILKKGEYHMVVHGCVFNSKGEMLIQKRQSFKSGWSNMWDVTCGGSAKQNETSRDAMQRELKEEVGIEHNFENETASLTVNFDNGFDDFYLINKDVDASKLSLQYEEVQAVKWAGVEEIMQMIDSGMFIPYIKSFIMTLFDLRGVKGNKMGTIQHLEKIN